MQRWLVRSCGIFGAGVVARYEGEPTTTIRMSGPIGTAIMSFAMIFPVRTPASKRRHDVDQAIIDDDFRFDVGIVRQEAFKRRP